MFCVLFDVMCYNFIERGQEREQWGDNSERRPEGFGCSRLMREEQMQSPGGWGKLRLSKGGKEATVALPGGSKGGSLSNEARDEHGVVVKTDHWK